MILCRIFNKLLVKIFSESTIWMPCLLLLGSLHTRTCSAETKQLEVGIWPTSVTSVAITSDCEHVAFTVKEQNGMSTAWLDGRKIAEGNDLSNVAISPDAKRFAYIEQNKGKATVICDGKVVGSFDHVGDTGARRDSRVQLHFSPDSLHLAFAAILGGHSVVVLDGETRPAGDGDDYRFSRINFSPDGRHFAFTMLGKDGAENTPNSLWVVDGSKGKSYRTVGPLKFSSDSRHWLYAAQDQATELWTIVRDGKEQSWFASVTDPIFSDDAVHYAFGAVQVSSAIDGGVLVFDETAHFVPKAADGTAGSRIWDLVLNQTGEHSAAVVLDQIFTGRFTGGGTTQFHVILDDQIVSKSYSQIEGLALSSNGEHFAFAAKQPQGNPGVERWTVVVGNVAGPSYPAVFLPAICDKDAHVAYGAFKDGKWIMIVDGVEIPGLQLIFPFANGKPDSLEDIQTLLHEASSIPYVFDSDSRLHFIGQNDGKLMKVIIIPDQERRK